MKPKFPVPVHHDIGRKECQVFLMVSLPNSIHSDEYSSFPFSFVVNITLPFPESFLIQISILSDP